MSSTHSVRRTSTESDRSDKSRTAARLSHDARLKPIGVAAIAKFPIEESKFLGPLAGRRRTLSRTLSREMREVERLSSSSIKTAVDWIGISGNESTS
jgi:hypothetical protein